MFKYMIGDTVCTKGSERIGTIVSLQYESITSDFNSYEVEFRQLPVRAGGEEPFTLTLYEKDLSLYNNKKEAEDKPVNTYPFSIGDKVIVINKNDSFCGKEGKIVDYDHHGTNNLYNTYLVDFGVGVNSKGFMKQRIFLEKELKRKEVENDTIESLSYNYALGDKVVVTKDGDPMNGAVGTIVKYIDHHASQDLNLYLVEFKLNLDGKDFIEKLLLYEKELEHYERVDPDGMIDSLIDDTIDHVEVEEPIDITEVEESDVDKAISEMKKDHSLPLSKFEIGDKVLYTDKTLNDHGMEDGSDTIQATIKGKVYDEELLDWIYLCTYDYKKGKLFFEMEKYFFCRETPSEDKYLSPLPITQKVYYIVDLNKRSIVYHTCNKKFLEDYKKQNDKLSNLSEIREVEVEFMVNDK